MRRNTANQIIASLATVLLCVGVGLAESSGPLDGQIASTSQPTTQPADTTVLVRLGDRAVIRQADVDLALINDRPERFDNIKESVVNRLVDDRIWDLYLLDHPDLVNDEDIERQIQNQLTRLRLKTVADLETMLRERGGITLDEHRQRLRRRLAFSRIGQGGMDQGKNDEDLQAIYDANPDHFNSTLVSARQIIIRSPWWDTPQQKEEKKQKLEKIRMDLVSGARTWDECMAESDIKLPNGGRMNSFKRYEISEELAKVAFELEPGQYSPVLETRLGFHLMQITHRKQGTNRLPNPQVKSQIMAYLQNRAKQQAIDSVLSKAPIIGVQPPRMPEFMRQALATRPAETQPAIDRSDVLNSEEPVVEPEVDPLGP
ncbi:MAG: hypothetical protein GXY44_08950 [Phycisphaerales bacterium]|nr:hypothetical protein [Phycisphaerales bacterium]